MMDDITALYIRLSDDDGGDHESNSVVNQRDLLNGYVAGNPVLSKTRIKEFSDDGWSGTNFQRPAVTEMLDMVREGGIQCIVVKDLSRFGRNYIEVSEYIDQIFPFLGVRFISVNDGYDSREHGGRTAPLNVGFNSIMHGVYSKELSVKVKQSYVTKAKKGEFLCGVAPFGYRRSETERNKLEIDEDAAATVRRIFSLAVDGHKTTEIAAILNREKIDTPLSYRKRKGLTLRGNTAAVRDANLWLDNNVRRVLTDERYTGIQVSGKTKKPCVGSNRPISVPESEWIKVPDAHEAIVPLEVFEQAQRVIRRFRMPKTEKRHVLFAGKLKCGHCGHALDYCKTKNPYYVCYSGRLTDDYRCFTGRLYVSDLKELVFSAVRTETEKAQDAKRRSDRKAKAARPLREAAAELKKLSLQAGQLRRQGFTLYEEFMDGRIDKDEYMADKEKYTQELSRTENRIAELNRILDNKGDKKETAEHLSLLTRLVDAGDVTEDMVSLIDRIVVYDEEHIEICFTFGDACNG